MMNRQSRGHYVSLALYALVNIGLGNTDEAFSWLNKAADEHSPRLPQITIDPTTATLRGDPRFAELVKKLGPPTRDHYRTGNTVFTKEIQQIRTPS
jgi:hypothetical protein